MSITIYDAEAADFAKYMVGHRIVAVNDTTITLDNGVRLEVCDSQDCCAGFYATIRALDYSLSDNLITAVTQIGAAPDTEEGIFSICVLCEDRLLAAIDVQGTASSGYYVHSIILKVTPARQEAE